ncbi:MAG: hypothetical protein AABM42_08200 [Actinomycetota bacterium]
MKTWKRLAPVKAGRGWNPAFLCLAGLVACSGAILLILQSHFTFFFDDWKFLLHRRGTSAGAFLDPHSAHIVLAPVSIYKLLLASFGMESALPFQVASTLIFLLSAVLLFIYLRRRVGDWAALLGTSLILFLGAGWEVLLWSFQVGFTGSVAAGLGMLLALDRDDRAGDRLACGLLVVSVAFSTLGLAFAAAAVVDLILSRRPRAGRLYVAVVPLALYAVWWLGWGHTATSSVSFHNVPASPKYVFDAVSQVMASLLGLATPLTGDGVQPAGLDLGRILLVVAIGLVGWRLRRLGGVPRALWIALAVGGTFWLLAALNGDPRFHPPTSGRYQYQGAIFVLLIAAELLRGVRVGRRAFAGAAVVTGVAVLSGLAFLHDGYKFLKGGSQVERGQLAAVEIARQTVAPGFTVMSGLFPIEAGAYLSAVDAFGSPAYTQAELVSSHDPVRTAADTVLAQALRIRLAPASRVSPGAAAGRGLAGRRCRTVKASPAGGTGLLLPPGEFTLKARAATEAEVLLGSFSDGLPVDLGTLRPGPGGSLTIAADRSTRPWRLGLRGAGPVTVCEAPPA